MKILVLGSNGQLGQDIQLVHQQLYGKQVTLIPWVRADLDVSNFDILREKLSSVEFDVLVNCTSFHKTDEVESNAQTAFTINSHAVAEMAKICKSKKAKFIHVSTDYVFGFHTYQRPLLETDVASPFNVYGSSKLMGESLAQLYCDQTYILRVASLFGIAGSSAKGGNFVTTMLKLGKERDQLNVVSDQFMSPTWTYEIAKAIFGLLDKQALPGLYHMVGSGSASWFDFAKAIFTIANYDLKVNPVKASEFPSKVVRPSYSVLNNEKIQNALHYRIPHWKESLQKWFEFQNSLVNS